MNGTSCTFLYDDALLLLHRFLAYNASGKQEGSKVNGTKCYLLWAVKNDVQVCLSPFFWG